MPLWVLGVKRVNHSRQDEINPLGRELGVHVNGGGGIQRTRWQEGKFATLLERFDSQTVFPGIINTDMLKKQLATLPRPQEAPGPPTPILRRK